MSTEAARGGEFEHARVFQIVIPPGDAQGVNDVWALGAQAGRLVTELDVPHTTTGTPVDPETLVAISNEYWGVPTYGQVAAKILDFEQKGLEGTVDHLPGKPNYRLSWRTTTLFPDIRATADDPLATIEAATREAIHEKGVPVPFTFSAAPQPTPNSPERYTPLLHIHPGIVTIEALRQYVSTRRYVQHELHGTLGRALDVLCVASEIITRPPALQEPLSSEELVSYDTLITEAAARPDISKAAVKMLFEKIDSKLSFQMLHGNTGGVHEVVIEGDCTPKRTGHSTKFTFDYIARSSLAVIIADYGSRTTPMVHYLRSLLVA